MNKHHLVFQNTTFDVVDRNGDAWLRGLQIGGALGYAKPDHAIWKLYETHKDEFTEDMTALVKLPTEGGVQEVRIFSPRGCYALAMFARTKVAKAFRRWVLDVLESIRKTGRYEAQPYAVNPGDTLTKEQADTLRNMISDAAEKLPQGKRGEFIRTGWSKLKSHFKTNYRQIPAAEFTEAVSIVSRHIIANAKQDRTAISHIEKMKIAEAYVKNARFVMSFDSKGMMQLHEVPESAVLLTPDEIVRHIAEPGTFPVSLLPSVIQAAGKRIQSAMPALIGA